MGEKGLESVLTVRLDRKVKEQGAAVMQRYGPHRPCAASSTTR